MKKLSEHKIVTILKEVEAGIPVKKFLSSIWYFINGDINIAVCNHPALSG